jgi:CRISPR-associated endonuclease Csn1
MKRLGLSWGTNSIGWCLIVDESRIADIGVRVFPDGREPPKTAIIGAPLAEVRRQARGARRRRDRYLRRRSAFLRALVRHRLMPADAGEAKRLAERDPYALRARAVEERLELFEIGRALFHLNQRRGFRSNRKAERRQKDKESGKIASGARALDHAIVEAGVETLGQLLAERDEKRVRMKGEDQEYDFYPQRRHVEHEFDRIWQAQSKHHPELLNEAARAELHGILFFQRPLKAPEVGACTFLHDERRLAKAHPLSQQCRLHEEVNRLEVATPGAGMRKLSLEERDALILALRERREASLDALADCLGLEPGQSLGLANSRRTILRGDEVHAAMSDRRRFGAAWPRFSPERQWEIIERILDEEDPDRLHAYLKAHGLDDRQSSATARAPLPDGHGRLGETATKLILDELRKDVITHDQAVERALGGRLSDERDGERLARLPYYGERLIREIPPGTHLPTDPPERRWGRITNPTVHIGLGQLGKLVNAIIAAHGRPDEIVVEIAGELKRNERQMQEHDRKIRDAAHFAALRSEELRDMGQADTGANRMRLRLWEELNRTEPLDRCCPYCGGVIDLEMLFDGTAGIDHVLPYSRTLDDSAANKVVAHRACIRAKGSETPWERWHADEARWSRIADLAGRLHKSKQWRFGPDAMEHFEKSGSFLARHLADAHHLSRLVRKYLSSLYGGEGEGHVHVGAGRITAMLRRLGDLDGLLADADLAGNAPGGVARSRLDHRYRAVDAAVAALTTPDRLQQIARAAARAEAGETDRPFRHWSAPWPAFREALSDRLSSLIVSHRPDRRRAGRGASGRDVTAGRLHDRTTYGLTGEVGADGETPVVVRRVAFDTLKPQDISTPGRIRDDHLRRELERAVGNRTGKAFEQALRHFHEEHPIFRGIRRVRVLGERAGMPTLNVIPIADKEGRPYKAYKGNANVRFIVWRLPDGEWTHCTVSMFDAHQRGFVPERPHPAARKVLDLRQNDLIAIEREGGPREIMRVVRISERGQLALAPHNEGGSLQGRHKSPEDPFRFSFPRVGGLRKVKARQIRIDPLGRLFDPGPRDPMQG